MTIWHPIGPLQFTRVMLVAEYLTTKLILGQNWFKLNEHDFLMNNYFIFTLIRRISSFVFLLLESMWVVLEISLDPCHPRSVQNHHYKKQLNPKHLTIK